MNEGYEQAAIHYDAIYRHHRGNGDVDFYRRKARDHGGPILELGCGTGRVGMPIIKDGHDYTGLDLSAGMLAVFRRKLNESGYENIRLVQQSMVAFELGQQFKLIIVPFRAFCHVLTVEDQLASLECMRRHLADDGLLIMDFFAPSYTRLANPITEPHLDLDVVDEATGDHIVRHVLVSYDHAVQTNDVTMLIQVTTPDGTTTTTEERFRMRFFFRYELEHLLVRTGFEPLDWFGHFDERPYDYASGEMIVTARKGRE